jgi:hypothetical protein
MAFDPNTNGPFGDAIPTVKGSAQAIDPGYIHDQLTRVYEAYGVEPTGPGTGATDIAYYTGVVIQTGGWFNDGTDQGNNAGYWYKRIGDDLAGTTAGPSTGAADGTFSISYGGANGALVNKQQGLLEDDIVYRLSLLAVNVLQPLKNQYPNIVVIGGFRQVNNGVSQHETGEAVDLQIQNQTPEQLFEVADYISKFLHFDQLILNWTDVGDGQGWIHVSFSPDSLREQVLTKDFADNFHDGLFLCQPLEGEEAAAALRAQADSDAAILADLQKQQARSERLGVTVQSDEGGGTSIDNSPERVLPMQGGGPDGSIVQFDHDWTGAVELKLRDILSTGLAGPDGGNGQAVVDEVNAALPYAAGIFQPRHDGKGYRTYGFPWFYVSYIPRDDDGTGFYQIVEFGTPPVGN